MKELLKMVWNRIFGNKPTSDYRYFLVTQSDGLQYEIEIHKDDVLKQLGYWVNNNEITFKEISKRTTENIKISLPPLVEQIKVVKILNAVFKRIDVLIANAEKTIAGALLMIR